MNNRQIEGGLSLSSRLYTQNPGEIACWSERRKDFKNNEAPNDSEGEYMEETYFGNCAQAFTPEHGYSYKHAIVVKQESGNDEFISLFNSYMQKREDENCSMDILSVKDVNWFNDFYYSEILKKSKDNAVHIYTTDLYDANPNFDNCIGHAFDYADKKQAQLNRDAEELLIYSSVGGVVGAALLLLCVYFTVRVTRNKFKEDTSNSEKKQLVEQSEKSTWTINLGSGLNKIFTLFGKEDRAVTDRKNNNQINYGTI